jgi:exodeoxyribonuclease VII small subunit
VPKKRKTEPFEEALQKLEKIVEKMEQGDMPLEKAMEAFTEGVQLVQYCHKKLDEAENKVQMLLEDQQGNWTAVPFDSSETEDSAEQDR